MHAFGQRGLVGDVQAVQKHPPNHCFGQIKIHSTMGDRFEDEDYGITRQHPYQHLYDTQPEDAPLLELGKSPRTNLQNEDLYFRNSSTIFGVEGPEDKETMGDPFPDEGCTALTAYLTKKTRRRPKIAGQPFRATYDLFLQPDCLRDFQSFAGAGWEQSMLVGTVVQCPSKKNGYKFKVDWENDSIPSEWLCSEIEGTHRNKAFIKQAVVSFANPKQPPNNGRLDSVNMSLTTPSMHDNVDSVPNVLLHMNLPFSPRTQPRNNQPIPNSADRAQALANLRTAPSTDSMGSYFC